METVMDYKGHWTPERTARMQEIVRLAETMTDAQARSLTIYATGLLDGSICGRLSRKEDENHGQ